MTNQADETYLVELIFETAEALDGSKKYRAEIDALKKALIDLRNQSNDSLGDVAEGFKKTQEKITKANKKIMVEINKLVSAGFTELADEMREKLEPSIENLSKKVQVAVSEINKVDRAADSARQGFQNTRKGVDELKDAMQRLAKTAGTDLTGAFEKMRDSGEYSTSALRSAKREIENAEPKVSSFGRVIETAFGFSLGTVAVDAIRAFIDILKEGIAKAGEFSTDVAKLTVNLRAFQRLGGDLSGEDLISFMEELGEKFALTEQEMAKAATRALALGRQFGFTGDQIKELLEVSAGLATMTKSTIPEAVTLMTRAMNTGRTQGLDRLDTGLTGTKISAMALAEGFIEVGEVLDDQTRAYLILREVVKRYNQLQGESVEVLDTFGGSQQRVSSAWQDLKKDMAEGFTPALKIVNEWLTNTIKGFNDFIDVYKRISMFLNTVVVTSFKGASVAAQNFWSALSGKDARIEFDWFDEFDQRFQELEKQFFPLEGLRGSDTGEGELLPDPEDVEGLADELEDAYKNLGIRIREALIDEQEKLEEAKENHSQRMDEIDNRYINDKEEREIKLGNDIAEINRKFNDELSEKNDEFRDRELDKEERFQEKLRKLRENFLLDLEDALRERDAKQVLSLIRRFNLREKQLKRQADLDKKQRQRRFQDQIDDIRRRRDIRIREAGIEFQERRDLALRDHQFRTSLENQRFQQRLADIREETGLRIEELTRRFEDEASITEEGAKQIRDILQKYFGAGGQVDRIYNHLIAKTAGTLSAVSTMVSMMAQQLASVGGTPMAEKADFLKADAEMTWRNWMQSRQAGKPGFAEGGTLLAMKPTTVQFGEKEPEIASFSPLSRIGQNEGKTFLSGDMPSGGNGKVRIELLLSEDLIARTENRVLAGAAEIITRRAR